MAVVAQLCLPVLGPLPPEEDQRQVHGQTLDDLRSLQEIHPLDPDFAGSPLRLELRARPEDEPLLKEHWKPRFQRRSYSLLSIYEKFRSERYGHEALATAVLIATLQWLVKRGEHTLEFEYAVKNNALGPRCAA